MGTRVVRNVVTGEDGIGETARQSLIHRAVLEFLVCTVRTSNLTRKNAHALTTNECTLT